MTEITEPRAPKRGLRGKLKLKTTDIIVLSVMVVIAIALAATIWNKLTLKHLVNGAQVISDQAIADFQKRDGAAVRNLGNDTFKKTYTAQQLTTQFKAVQVATSKAPKLESTVVASGKSGHAVYFIYKYSVLKVPFYVRTIIVDKSGDWELTEISGSVDESTLHV